MRRSTRQYNNSWRSATAIRRRRWRPKRYFRFFNPFKSFSRAISFVIYFSYCTYVIRRSYYIRWRLRAASSHPSSHGKKHVENHSCQSVRNDLTMRSADCRFFFFRHSTTRACSNFVFVKNTRRETHERALPRPTSLRSRANKHTNARLISRRRKTNRLFRDEHTTHSVTCAARKRFFGSARFPSSLPEHARYRIVDPNENNAMQCDVSAGAKRCTSNAPSVNSASSRSSSVCH